VVFDSYRLIAIWIINVRYLVDYGAWQGARVLSPEMDATKVVLCDEINEIPLTATKMKGLYCWFRDCIDTHKLSLNPKFGLQLGDILVPFPDMNPTLPLPEDVAFKISIPDKTLEFVDWGIQVAKYQLIVPDIGGAELTITGKNLHTWEYDVHADGTSTPKE
jgi:hypothetical protein